jgi:hypothetical protein
MRIIQTPQEPIFADAWNIAHAIVRQQDQETRMAKALEREGIMSNRVTALSNDIVRLEVLIQDRIKAWTANYGTDKSWKQYLDGCPQQSRIDQVAA